MTPLPRKPIALLLSALLFAAPVLAPVPASAQFGFGGVIYCSNCSTLTDQLVQYAQEAQTALNTANSYAKQIQMYENMVQQGTQLPSQVWGSINSDLSSLNSLVATGTNIAYATGNIGSQFSTQFPSFTTFLNRPQTAAQTQADLVAWTKEIDDSARTSLQAANTQSTQMQSEADLMNTIQGHSQAAVGELQAIQAGNEAASQIVQQLQKLRQLVMTMISMQSEAMAAQSRQAAADKATDSQFASDPSTVTVDSHVADAGFANWPQ